MDVKAHRIASDIFYKYVVKITAYVYVNNWSDCELSDAENGRDPIAYYILQFDGTIYTCVCARLSTNRQ